MDSSVYWLVTSENVPEYVRHKHVQRKYHHDPLKYALMYDPTKPLVTKTYIFFLCMYRSLTSFHTETLNIYTMMFNALFSTMYMYMYSPCRSWAHYMLWGSCVLHAPFSITYHMCMSLGKRIYTMTCALDMTFIVISSIMLQESFMFAMNSTPKMILRMGMLCISARTLYIIRNMYKNEHMMPLLFVQYLSFLVIMYIAPVALTNKTYAFKIGIALFIGCILFITKIPELFFNKTVLASHELMHVMIFIAHMYGYAFIRDSCEHVSTCVSNSTDDIVNVFL